MTTHSERDAVAWNKHREQQRQRYALPRLTVTRLSEEAYQPKQFEKAGALIVPTNVVPTIASTTTP
jgi:hypothetical protein